MVNVIGNATAMMPVDSVVMAQLLEEQQTVYDGVSSFLAQRGSQALSTSVYASTKPSGRFNRKPYKHYKANGNVYLDIANGYKGSNGYSDAANAPSTIESSVAPFKAVALKSETKPLAAAPETAPVINTEVKSFVPAAPSTGHYVVLASPEAFMASVRMRLNQAAGTLNSVSANTETKSVVETVQTTSDAGIGAKHVTNTVKDTSVVNPKVSEHVTGTTSGDDKTEIKSVVDTAETTSNVNIEANPTAGTPAARVHTEVTLKAEHVVYTEAISYPPSAASTHWSVLATNKQFMASVRKCRMEWENAAASTRNTIVAVANTEVTPSTASGVNPEAKPFVPAGRLSAGSSGLVSNDKFMASARKFIAGGGLSLGKYRKSAMASGSSSPAIKPRDAPARVLLFKNVPEWLNIPDILGFVYGGAVDCIFRSNMAEITVQFCEEAACMAYLDAHPNGIRVQHPTIYDEVVTIIVERASRGEEVTPTLQMKMAIGGSRLVRVDGIFDAEKLQALTARAMEYEVDHIMFCTEKDKMGSAYVFFCGLADGWTFKQRLQQEDEAWNEFVVLFMADPCKVATAFHDNTIPNRMASAVAV